MSMKRRIVQSRSLAIACGPEFWSWWINVIADMLPVRAKTVLRGSHLTSTVAFDGSDIKPCFSGSAGNINSASRIPPDKFENKSDRNWFVPGQMVQVALDPRLVITSCVTLPDTSRAKIDSIVNIEVERRTPFRKEEMRFGYKIVESNRKKKMLVIEIVVASLNVIRRAQEAARALGLQPAIVGLFDATSPVLQPILLQEKPLRDDLSGRPKQWFGLAFLFFLLSFSFVSFRQSSMDHVWTEALDTAKSNSTGGLASRAYADIFSNSVAAVVQKSHEPTVSDIVSELTRLLSDDTWVSEFSLNGNQLHIVGLSGAATPLLQTLSSGSLFEHPHFMAPITVQNGKERFDLILTVRGRRVVEGDRQ